MFSTRFSLLPRLRTAPSTSIRRLDGVFTEVAVEAGGIVLHTVNGSDVEVHSLVSSERTLKGQSRGVSDHRFLALRHSWSSGNFFYFASGVSGSFNMVLPTRALHAISAPQLDTDTRPQIFDVNDPFEWKLPTEDDVASSSYWRQFQEQVEQYRRVGPSNSNVTLRRVSKGGREGVALVASTPIPAGSELFLHYGLGWWVPKILSQVFLAVDSPAGLEQVRWVEALANPRGTSDPDGGVLAPTARFPSIVLKRVLCRWKSAVGGVRYVSVLWNSVSDAVATDEEVRAFLAWKSCVDPSFANEIAKHFVNERAVYSSTGTVATVTSMRCLRRLLRDHISQ